VEPIPPGAPVPLANIQHDRLRGPSRLIRERPVAPLDPLDQRTAGSGELLGDLVDMEGGRSVFVVVHHQPKRAAGARTVPTS